MHPVFATETQIFSKHLLHDLQQVSYAQSPILNKQNTHKVVTKLSIAAIFIGNNRVNLVCGNKTNLNAVNDKVTINTEIEIINTNAAFFVTT